MGGALLQARQNVIHLMVLVGLHAVDVVIYIAYNGSLYLAQGIFGYLLKLRNGIAWGTVTAALYNH